MVSGLVLNFIPDPDAALAEMSRVATDGATIAAYVWDYAEGMQMLRAFWDAAVALDPGAADLDEATRFPLCRPEPLRQLFDAAGLSDVEQARHHRGRPRSPTSTTTGRRSSVARARRPATARPLAPPTWPAAGPPPRASSRPDGGPIDLTARAWAIKGTRVA